MKNIQNQVQTMRPTSARRAHQSPEATLRRVYKTAANKLIFLWGQTRLENMVVTRYIPKKNWWSLQIFKVKKCSCSNAMCRAVLPFWIALSMPILQVLMEKLIYILQADMINFRLLTHLNTRDNSGRTPLHVTCLVGNFEMVTYKQKH